MYHVYIYTYEIQSQLSLLSLGSQVRHEQVAQFVGCFGEEVTHAVGANTLADDVEVETGIVTY